MTTASWILLALGVLTLLVIVVAAVKGWLRPFVTNHNGEFSSALFWRSVWHLITVSLTLWSAAKWGPTTGVLAFAAGMAGVEGVQNWARRAQDKKAAAKAEQPSE